MQRNVRYVFVAVVALIVGATGAETYARLAIPYYEVVNAGITQLYPWRLLDIYVYRDSNSPSATLRMTGAVRRTRQDLLPAAIVVVNVQVGDVVQTPVVFWTVVFAWPMATWRRRWVCLAVAIPVFLLLEAVTTGCQLAHSMAQASAMLAGVAEPLTGWERWARFLEAGGGVALELSAALLTVGLSAGRIRIPAGRRVARSHVPIISSKNPP